LLVKNAETNADVTILTAYLDNLQEYGRISRDYKGCIKGIIESGEASTDELKIKEINVGIYVFRVSSLLEGIDLIVPHNKKGEFYLTDIMAILYNRGKKIENIVSENTAEVMGINNQRDLAVANNQGDTISILRNTSVSLSEAAAAFAITNATVALSLLSFEKLKLTQNLPGISSSPFVESGIQDDLQK